MTEHIDRLVARFGFRRIFRILWECNADRMMIVNDVDDEAIARHRQRFDHVQAILNNVFEGDR